MRSFRALVFAVALATSSATARTPEPAFSADAVKAHVVYLADDALEGRATGTRGYDMAAAYVASRFAALGLTPAGEDGGWYQKVRFQERSLGPKGARLTISGPNGARTWENGTEIIVGPSAVEAEQDVEAPVVFAGYGIDAPGQGFDDYRGLDVKGKVVAVLNGFPAGTPSELGAHLDDEKAAMAKARGAVGVVSIDTLRWRKTFPWSNRVRGAKQPRLAWLDGKGRPHVGAPELRASGLLNTPAAQALFAGAPRTLDAVLKEADRRNGKPRGFPLRTSVRVQRSSVWKTVESAEVIGMVPGSDPKLGQEVIVLMAHLDHLGVRPERQGDRIYNGAIDNAAGVATMLEVARAFATGQERPRRSILFIANTAEEKGLLGADYFAHHPTVPVERIVGLVNLDMPMLLYDFTDVVAFGANHSTVGEHVARATAPIGIRLASDPMPEEGIFTRSDHYALVRKGVPAVLIMTGWANGGEKAWKDFLANRYHQPDDDLTQKIDWQAGAKFARINYLVTRELANADKRPLWYKGDYFGDRFAPRAEKAKRR